MSFENPKYRENVILDLTLKFSLEAISFCEILEADRKYVIARQLLKSATSIGANVREAQNAESRSDFVHKLKIALKEADETEYWLLLCDYSKTYPSAEHLQSSLRPIRMVLNKIVSTSKKNS